MEEEEEAEDDDDVDCRLDESFPRHHHYHLQTCNDNLTPFEPSGLQN